MLYNHSCFYLCAATKWYYPKVIHVATIRVWSHTPWKEVSGVEGVDVVGGDVTAVTGPSDLCAGFLGCTKTKQLVAVVMSSTISLPLYGGKSTSVCLSILCLKAKDHTCPFFARMLLVFLLDWWGRPQIFFSTCRSSSSPGCLLLSAGFGFLTDYVEISFISLDQNCL